MTGQYIEIFTLVTGLIYLVLEILQKNAMWIVGMVTSAAAVYMFASQELYASTALNVYYLVISAVGFSQWRKDRRKLRESGMASASDGRAVIHLNRLSPGFVYASLGAAVAGTVLLAYALKFTGDRMPVLDAAIAILNAIATYWLSRAYYQQWYILVFVNILSSILCFSQGLYWMTAQYVFYSAASVYGLLHWKRRGIYLGQECRGTEDSKTLS